MTEKEKELLSYHNWRQAITVTNNLKTPGRIKETLWSHIGMPNDLQGKKFLDIGSNDGMFCFIAESKGATVFGSDLYKESLSSMREGWPLGGIHLLKDFKKSNITLHHNGIYKLDEIGEKMDVVLVSNVINWLDDIENGIAQLCKITSGELIISDGFLYKNDIANREAQQVVRFFYNLKYIENLLNKNGFKLKSVTPLNSYRNFIRSYSQTIHIVSDGEIKVYTYPDNDSPYKTIEGIKTSVNSENGNFYFIPEQGWIRKSDVTATSNKLSAPYRLSKKLGLEGIFTQIKENSKVKKEGIKTYKLIAIPA